MPSLDFNDPLYSLTYYADGHQNYAVPSIGKKRELLASVKPDCRNFATGKLEKMDQEIEDGFRTLNSGDFPGEKEPSLISLMELDVYIDGANLTKNTMTFTKLAEMFPTKTYNLDQVFQKLYEQITEDFRQLLKALYPDVLTTISSVQMCSWSIL